MTNLSKILGGVKVLEETDSKINGHLVVKKDLAWGTYIQANGLTQSGGIVERIWRKTFKKVISSQDVVDSVLILGMGGGTIAKMVRKHYPEAKITGVDVDPLMIKLGRKYLGLNNLKLKIIIADAEDSLTDPGYKLLSTNYDLIFIDLYLGDKFPEKFGNEKFLNLIKKSLSGDGIAVFNRLYGGNRRGDAMRFLKKLEKVFPKVDPFYPEANVIFVCKC